MPSTFFSYRQVFTALCFSSWVPVSYTVVIFYFYQWRFSSFPLGELCLDVWTLFLHVVAWDMLSRKASNPYSEICFHWEIHIYSSNHFFEIWALWSFLPTKMLQSSKTGRYWVILGTDRKEVYSCSSLGIIILIKCHQFGAATLKKKKNDMSELLGWM